MARKPLRSQLNQIRAWVRQGRTDAWIAHQLDVPASELREFRRRHDLAPEEDMDELELRDQIEAEIEALGEAEPDEEAEAEDEDEPSGEEGEGEGAEGAPRRRRRRRRRGGSASRAPSAIQATFDHGDTDGFGLWLDPAVRDDAVYAEHWAGHRKVEVTIEPDRIVIRRV